MAETRGRRTRANVSAFAPRTKYQEWLDGALERRGVDVAELARMTNADYSHVWRIARGDPDKYPNSRRPGYDLALAIGEALKDVPGSLAAAEWETPSLRYVTDPDTARLVELYEGTPPAGKQMILSAAQLANDLSREGAIGGRRADDDDNPTEPE